MIEKEEEDDDDKDYDDDDDYSFFHLISDTWICRRHASLHSCTNSN